MTEKLYSITQQEVDAALEKLHQVFPDVNYIQVALDTRWANGKTYPLQYSVYFDARLFYGNTVNEAVDKAIKETISARQKKIFSLKNELARLESLEANRSYRFN